MIYNISFRFVQQGKDVMKEIRRIIKDTVASALNYSFSLEDISEKTNLLTDLEIDSLAYVQIIIDLEEKFDVELESEVLDIETVQLYIDFENAIIKQILNRNSNIEIRGCNQ